MVFNAGKTRAMEYYQEIVPAVDRSLMIIPGVSIGAFISAVRVELLVQQNLRLQLQPGELGRLLLRRLEDRGRAGTGSAGRWPGLTTCWFHFAYQGRSCNTTSSSAGPQNGHTLIPSIPQTPGSRSDSIAGPY